VDAIGALRLKVTLVAGKVLFLKREDFRDKWEALDREGAVCKNKVFGVKPHALSLVPCLLGLKQFWNVWSFVKWRAIDNTVM